MGETSKSNPKLPKDIDQYVVISHFVLSLAEEPSLRNRPWNLIEKEAQTRWEKQHPGTWDQCREKIFQAWENAKDHWR